MEKMMKMKPIDTAPKDGRWVFLTGGTCDEYCAPIVAGFWLKNNPIGLFHKNEYWAIYYWDGGWGTSYDNPTHWCEFPFIEYGVKNDLGIKL